MSRTTCGQRSRRPCGRCRCTSWWPSRRWCWICAHVVAGIGVYALFYTQRDWVDPPWDVLGAVAAAALLTLAAATCLARRRWRTGAWLLAGSVLTVAGHLLWTGRVFLQNEWNEVFLRW